MRNKRSFSVTILLMTFILSSVIISCKRDFDDLDPATFSTNGEVFIDGFSSGLEYGAYGGSKLTAFQVDNDIVYDGEASMRFDVPNPDDPTGNYAGGAFYVADGRDLSGFNALTFWVRASQSATIDQLGFGDEFGEGDSEYRVTLKDLKVSTAWEKVIIPIPDPSKLIQEKGLFFFSDGTLNDNGAGYSFWVDEVQFESLGTLAHYEAGIQGKRNDTVSAETGQNITVEELILTVSLLDDIEQLVEISPSYLTFTSSETSVATVSSLGVAMVLDAGTAVITAKMGDVDAVGSLAIVSTGEAILPPTAPVPTVNSDSVISLYSNVYNNVPVDFFNGYWTGDGSTTVEDYPQVDGDDMIRYKLLNFVGIQFANPTVDASEMTHLHMDIWTPDETAGKQFKIEVFDAGPDGAIGGGDDIVSETTFMSPALETGEWVSLDIPLPSTKTKLALIVLSGDIPNVFVDNIYFYIGNEDVGNNGPTEAAPTPTRDAADVISVFSDAYTNIGVSDFNPNWGQSGAASQVSVDGNNTLKYDNFNYQGTQFTGNEDLSDMEFVHIDMWTTDATDVKFTPIGDGETLVGLTPITSGQWVSYDIPLSEFTDVDFSQVGQLKFDGQGGTNPSNIWIDNIYFYKTSSTGGDCSTPQSPSLTSLPIDFENCEDLSGVFESGDGVTGAPIENPDKTGINTSDKVYQLNKVSGAAWYSGLFHIFPSNFDMTTNKVFKMKIWSPKANVIVRFQIEKEGNQGPIATFNKTQTVATANTWTELTFDFSGDALTGPIEYDKIVIIPDDEDNGPADGSIYYIDDIELTTGGSTPTEPTTAAPTPTRDAADVISVFSDAYTDINVSDFNPNWGQSGSASQVSVSGNNTLKYDNFNYQGTQFTGNEDMSSMEFVHIDVWTADATDIKFTPISASTGEFLVNLTPITSGEWNSYDIPLSDFTGVSFGDILQLKFDGQGGTNPSNIWIDNIYFYKEPSSATEPTTAAPTPTRDAADVISVFSDAYTDINVSDPNWGQSGSASQVSVSGNNTLKYDNFNYQGTQFTGNEDMSSMEFVHIDVWTADATDIKFTPISASTGEFLVNLTPITSGEWNSYDIPLSDFTGVSFGDILQLKFDGQGGTNPSNIWIDNIYFYKEPSSATEPTTAAPTPTRDAADVISVFSDAYTDINVSDFNPNWGQSGSASQVSVSGNNTLKYDNFNYQGTQFTGNEDMSSMEFVHIDVWTADATDIKFTPISASTGEFLVNLTPITSGEWNSYDIPLSDFTGVSFGDILQLKFDGQGGTNPSNIWIDNIYFYKEPSSATEPTTAAPTPTRDAADVISVFSDAYTDINVSDFNPNWGQSGSASQVSVSGNNTLKYDNFNYQGTQFTGNEDMSSMEFVHIDVWTADATDIKFTPISASTGEFLVNLTPITSGEWNSYDIPLSDFTGVSFGDILQLKFDGQGGTNPSNIWIDNIYFYKTSSSGGCSTPQAPNLTTFPIDFENCENLSGVFEDGDGVTGFPAENPNKTGINTTDKVYQFNKVSGAAWYSGIFHIFSVKF